MDGKRKPNSRDMLQEILQKASQPVELDKEATEAPKISLPIKEIMQKILQKASQPVELVKEGTEAPKMPLEACKLRAKTTRTPCKRQTSRTKNPIDYPSPNSESQLTISVPVNGNEGPDSHFQKRTESKKLGDGESIEKKKGGWPKGKPRKKPISTPTGMEQSEGSLKDESSAAQAILESKKLGDGESSEKKKRGWPKGKPRKKPISTPTGMEQSECSLKDESSAAQAILESKKSGDGESSEKKNSGWPKGKPRKKRISTPTGKKGRLLKGKPRKKPISTPTGMEQSEGSLKHESSTAQAILESKKLGDGESSEKKKRGWPKGKPRKNPISTPTGMEQSEGSLKDESSDLVDLLEVPIAHTRKRTRASLIKMSNGKVVQSSVQQYEKHYIKMGKRQRRSANIESQSQGSGDASRVKNTETIRISSSSEEVLAEAAHNCLDDQDDQPLAKWFEEMQSQTSVDGSRVPPAYSPKQSAEMGEKQDMPTQTAEMEEKQDMPMQTAVNLTLTTQTETPIVPFVKNTLLWATVESMDIFRRIPQKPHFRPLEHCEEISREGQAIGCMVTFSSIAEKISSLHYNDPRSTINEILKTLNDLEKHGFDVQLLRNRLKDLLLMKDKIENLEAQAADIDDKIIKHSTDGKNIDAEIEEIKAKIEESKTKLSLAISRKEVNDRELDALRSQLGDIQAGMKNKHNEYEGFRSKPL